MKKLIIFTFWWFTFWLFLNFTKTLAHEINHQVKEVQTICISLFFSNKQPMNYAEVEVYAPEGNIVFQKARTDKNGIFCFLPDKEGTWEIKAKGETEHGFHGTHLEIKINKTMNIEEFKKPLVAKHTKIVVALGIVGWIIGVLGVYLYLKNTKRIKDK